VGQKVTRMGSGWASPPTSRAAGTRHAYRNTCRGRAIRRMLAARRSGRLSKGEMSGRRERVRVDIHTPAGTWIGARCFRSRPPPRRLEKLTISQIRLNHS